MAETNPATRQPWRWRRLVILGALALNLLVLGLIAGAAYGIWGKGNAPRHIDRITMGLGDYILALPPDARDRMRAAGSGFGREARRARFAKLRAGRTKIRAALEAEDFDIATLRRTIEEQRETALAGTIALQEAFVEEVARMTDDERAQMIETARATRKERRHRHRD